MLPRNSDSLIGIFLLILSTHHGQLDHYSSAKATEHQKLSPEHSDHCIFLLLSLLLFDKGHSTVSANKTFEDSQKKACLESLPSFSFRSIC